MVYNRRRPDGGEAWNVDTVDMVPMCRTVAGITRTAPDESSDTSGTDTAELIGSDIEVSGQWPDSSDEMDCFGPDVGSSVDGSLSFSDFDSVDSDVVLIQTRAPWRIWNGTLGMKSDKICDMGDGCHPAWDVCCTGRAFDTHGYVGCVDGNNYMARLCLLRRPGMESMMQRNEEYGGLTGMEPWTYGYLGPRRCGVSTPRGVL